MGKGAERSDGTKIACVWEGLHFCLEKRQQGGRELKRGPVARNQRKSPRPQRGEALPVPISVKGGASVKISCFRRMGGAGKGAGGRGQLRKALSTERWQG